MSIPLIDLKAQYLSIKKEVNKVIRNILENSTFIAGEAVEKFEKEFGKFCGARYAVGLSSGTS